ncbi:hypothetical protein WA026_018076 [Henosepilachna vigintioctopunctata]|uniref:UPF3 domain-containing protein n=1 Tax=Henosepilachna vigintioctopunctata TaxID=420089 RepID=A0AAW1UPW4_9CUCU
MITNMALPEEIKSTAAKASQNSNSQKQEKREKPLTKVIIRRLPPAIDKETFLNQISPVPSYDYFYLVNGEAALGENSFARAYLNFLNPNDVFDFKEKFDNYVFLDQKGNEYAAVVEFSAFQKIPKKRNKSRVDPKCGTIETDPYYLEFIENLNKPIDQEDKPEYSYQFSTESKDSKDLLTTPLLEYVKNRRVERMRVREERREERRRKELERKKMREEDRKKRFDEKSPTKVFAKLKAEDRDNSDLDMKDSKREVIESKSEKSFERLSSYRSKEKKFEDRKKDFKTKPVFKKEFSEKREFKSRKEHFKEAKFDCFKKDEKQFPKKVKKYSEKREERKIEAQRAEMKRAEEKDQKSTSPILLTKDIKEEKKDIEIQDVFIKKTSKNDDDSSKSNEKILEISTISEKSNPEPLTQKEKQINDDKESIETLNDDFKSVSIKEKTKESRERKERIRNKDRPTIAIYRPGMLSRRKLADGDTDKEVAKEVDKDSK